MCKELFFDLKFQHVCPGVMIVEAKSCGYYQFGTTDDYGNFIVISQNPSLIAQLDVSMSNLHDEGQYFTEIPQII